MPFRTSTILVSLGLLTVGACEIGSLCTILCRNGRDTPPALDRSASLVDSPRISAQSPTIAAPVEPPQESENQPDSPNRVLLKGQLAYAAGVELPDDNAPRFAGSVLAADDGAEEHFGKVDDEGHFTIALPCRRFRIEAIAPECVASGAIDVNLATSPAPGPLFIEMQTAARLAGVVRNSDMTLIRDAEICVRRPGTSICLFREATNRYGSFEVLGLAPGVYHGYPLDSQGHYPLG